MQIGLIFDTPFIKYLKFLIISDNSIYITIQNKNAAINFSYIGFAGLVKNLSFVITVSCVVSQCCMPSSRNNATHHNKIISI